MKAKKSPQADLESKKSIFLQIGFVIALGLAFLAFEWSSIDSDYSRYDLPDDIIPALDKEALRVITSLPDWKSGKQAGHLANVRFTVPINFRLQ